MPAIHHLKTWPAYWEAIERGDKTFEVRKNDRAFQTGDTLMLEYFDPTPEAFPGYSNFMAVQRQALERRVTFVLPGGQFGIEAGYVVMGIAPVERT